jgi:type I restriction enzyme M protein
MLGKIASAGQNGQFRTPRHIIATMVELVEPKPEDVICDPAVGTCGFLVAAGEYLRKHHVGLFRDDKLRRHFNEGLFNGFDFDPTMLRIGSMNMALHGVESANVSYRDSLAEDHAEDAAGARPSSYPRACCSAPPKRTKIYAASWWRKTSLMP